MIIVQLPNPAVRQELLCPTNVQITAEMLESMALPESAAKELEYSLFHVECKLQHYSDQQLDQSERALRKEEQDGIDRIKREVAKIGKYLDSSNEEILADLVRTVYCHGFANAIDAVYAAADTGLISPEDARIGFSVS